MAKAKLATPEQREMWERMRGLGCMACGGCNYIEIHHCGTGGGGRKNHDYVIPLGHYHHRGAEGIHTIGRKKWQAHYGSERELFEKTMQQLGEP